MIGVEITVSSSSTKEGTSNIEARAVDLSATIVNVCIYSVCYCRRECIHSMNWWNDIRKRRTFEVDRSRRVSGDEGPGG